MGFIHVRSIYIYAQEEVQCTGNVLIARELGASCKIDVSKKKIIKNIPLNTMARPVRAPSFSDGPRT